MYYYIIHIPPTLHTVCTSLALVELVYTCHVIRYLAPTPGISTKVKSSTNTPRVRNHVVYI